MKILMLNSNITGRGTYWRAFGFGRELSRCGHAVTLLSIAPGSRIGITEREDEGVHVVETPELLPGKLRSGWDPFDILTRIRLTHGRSFDLIHGFESRPIVILPALYLQKRLGIPLILDWADWFGRGGSVEERANSIERGILRPVETFFEESFRTRANAATVICTLLQGKALALGLLPEQVLLLPNGADVESIYPKDRCEARQRLGLSLHTPLVAYTGASFQRDADLMASAFRFILRSRPDARLLLVGYTRTQLDLPPQAVVQTGKVSQQQLVDYLAACDLGWLPLQDSGANRGRFPMKFHDFLAAGRCIVATDVGDVGKIMREDAIGYLSPPIPEALAQIVLNLLENNESRENMEKRARYLAETKFAWSIVTSTLAKFYLECCS